MTACYRRKTMVIALASLFAGMAMCARSAVTVTASKEYVDRKLAAALNSVDTSYDNVDSITNANQTVAYVTNAPVLSIEIPVSGKTRDWIVYAYFESETPLVLPAGTWWMADDSCTNSIPPNIPTAFYFSQVSDGIFTISRQMLMKSVRIQSP